MVLKDINMIQAQRQLSRIYNQVTVKGVMKDIFDLNCKQLQVPLTDIFIHKELFQKGISKGLKGKNVYFISQLISSDGLHLLRYKDLKHKIKINTQERIPSWFKFIENTLIEKLLISKKVKSEYQSHYNKPDNNNDKVLIKHWIQDIIDNTISPSMNLPIIKKCRGCDVKTELSRSKRKNSNIRYITYINREIYVKIKASSIQNDHYIVDNTIYEVLAQAECKHYSELHDDKKCILLRKDTESCSKKEDNRNLITWNVDSNIIYSKSKKLKLRKYDEIGVHLVVAEITILILNIILHYKILPKKSPLIAKFNSPFLVDCKGCVYNIRRKLKKDKCLIYIEKDDKFKVDEMIIDNEVDDLISFNLTWLQFDFIGKDILLQIGAILQKGEDLYLDSFFAIEMFVKNSNIEKFNFEGKLLQDKKERKVYLIALIIAILLLPCNVMNHEITSGFVAKTTILMRWNYLNIALEKYYQKIWTMLDEISEEKKLICRILSEYLDNIHDKIWLIRYNWNNRTLYDNLENKKNSKRIKNLLKIDLENNIKDNIFRSGIYDHFKIENKIDQAKNYLLVIEYANSGSLHDYLNKTSIDLVGIVVLDPIQFQYMIEEANPELTGFFSSMIEVGLYLAASGATWEAIDTLSSIGYSACAKTVTDF
ncbi:hypothetical protein C1646_752455 [Rhizophagus diaphanus]|nr:hypothetical protein C1646_752455 [Rhizophagus diaphanus] [Rhizophagus sp. MUCL 43196]